jgi:hypothetical protein
VLGLTRYAGTVLASGSWSVLRCVIDCPGGAIIEVTLLRGYVARVDAVVLSGSALATQLTRLLTPKTHKVVDPLNDNWVFLSGKFGRTTLGVLLDRLSGFEGVKTMRYVFVAWASKAGRDMVGHEPVFNAGFAPVPCPGLACTYEPEWDLLEVDTSTSWPAVAVKTPRPPLNTAPGWRGHRFSPTLVAEWAPSEAPQQPIDFAAASSPN